MLSFDQRPYHRATSQPRLPDVFGGGAEKPVSLAKAEILSAASRLPEDQLRTAVQLICTAGLEFRWGEKKEEKNNNGESRKTGQDADICKRSDTDLEKASCSGWLVNRGVKLPCGSESAGKSQPTDSTCTFLLLMFTAR